MRSCVRFPQVLSVAVCTLLVPFPGCASGRAGPSAEPLPPGLQSGAHEAVLNGVRHWYRVGGDAPRGTPPLVFLHGGPGQGSAHFDALAGPHLERWLRVVYFDQRGSGHSDRPADGDYAIATLVEDVEALRRALGVPQVALVGHSFGGLLALEYAARYPAQVSHIVFAAGVWDFPLQCRLRVERLGQLIPEAYARLRGDTLRADGTRRSDCELEFQALSGQDRDRYNTQAMFPDPAIEARMDSVNAARGVRNTGEMSRFLFADGAMFQYRFEAFDRLTMPVLVVAGRYDGAAQSAGLRALAERLPGGRFVEYERSGHFMYLDEPERFARDVAALLLGVSPPRARD